MNKCLTALLLIATLTSCARMTQKSPKEMLSNQDEQFNYTDKNGQFNMKVSSGLDKKINHFLRKELWSFQVVRKIKH